MAKKFVRSITGIENINEQDMDTNNVGDLLSDGQDIYVHRKTPTGDEYFNLTKENTKLIADGDSGLEIWKKDGEDGKRIKLSQEFLKNNAQYISAKENSGLKATPRQDKYGKSYELDFTDEAKAKIQDVVDKVNKVNVAMVPEIDNLKTLIEGTTVEAPLTKSYNQTPKGRTVNLALAESAKNKINKVDTIENNVTELTEKVEGLQPVFKNINVNGIRGSLFAIPYGGMGNYLATISLQTTAIDSNAPVKIPISHEVSKWLNNMNLPSPGYLQSGSVLIRKESSGGVEVRTSGSMDALYYHGVFQVVLSSL